MKYFPLLGLYKSWMNFYFSIYLKTGGNSFSNLWSVSCHRTPVWVYRYFAISEQKWMFFSLFEGIDEIILDSS